MVLYKAAVFSLSTAMAACILVSPAMCASAAWYLSFSTAASATRAALYVPYVAASSSSVLPTAS